MTEPIKRPATAGEFLKAFLTMTEGYPPGKGNRHYATVSSFVLAEGREMLEGPPPDRAYHGRLGECYHNALELMVRRPDRYTYCEGYAMCIIPTMHAWCLDKETGLVADPTWGPAAKLAEYKKAYHGVPMDDGFVMAYAVRTGTSGILDDWINDWPVLKREWKDGQPATNILSLITGGRGRL